MQGAAARPLKDTAGESHRDVAASELSARFLRDVAAAIEAVPEALGRRGYGVHAPAGTEDIMRLLLPSGISAIAADRR
ncbi:hypothetical protein [Bradyrhizobium cenepequi]|uniref:hypothetical protein n=1 Tax=Bradyrhizobium cenepequi TaxID=2821403 RepID=UPI001CE3302C|nr:hypothetical protein [Bradyrhizobium cenepequi]MCA6112700.1 hypothetical protein [Bradyrhizobium cenepequi]